MNETPTMPEPLSMYELHSPTERRSHATKIAAFHDAKREEEVTIRRKQEAAEAAANAPLDDDAYFKLALKRQQDQQAKDAQREAQQKADKDAATAYLESSPELAEVTADNPYHLLVKLEHWIKRGYRITEQSVHFWLPNFQHVVLAAPAPAVGKGGKQ